MGIFDTLRRRSGLVVVAIGLALGAFILGEFFSSAGFIFGEDQDAVGYINGEKVDITEVAAEMEKLRFVYPQDQQVSNMELSDEAWSIVLGKKLIGNQLEDLGFVLNEDEKWNNFAKQASRMPIGQNFIDPQTNQFNTVGFRSEVENILASEDPQYEQIKNYLQSLKSLSDNNAAMANFYMAVGKGMRQPKRIYLFDQNRFNVNADVVVSKLSIGMPGLDTVKASQADYLRAYLQKKESDNGSLFLKQESKDLVFEYIPLKPSSSDRGLVASQVLNLKENYQNTTEDSVFTTTHSQGGVYFGNFYFSESDFDQFGLLKVFSALSDQQKGFVTDTIYLERNDQQGLDFSYGLFKLLDEKVLPETVIRKHIAIAYGENAPDKRNEEQAKKLADSLAAGFNSNQLDFDVVSGAFNDDVRAKSGQLEEMKNYLSQIQNGAYPKSYVDFCFFKDRGTVGIVSAPGAYYVVKIEEHTGEVPSKQFSQVVKQVNISKKTRDMIFEKARNKALALKRGEAQSLNPLRVTSVTSRTNNGVSCRELVKWAFGEDRELNDVNLIEDDNRLGYFVVGIEAAYSPGYIPLDDILEGGITYLTPTKNELDISAQNIAKARYLAANWDRFKPERMDFGSLSINEPFIYGMIMGGSASHTSEVLQGMEGAYQFNLKGLTKNEASPFNEEEWQRKQAGIRSAIQSKLLNALIDKAEIKDLRGRFY